MIEALALGLNFVTTEPNKRYITDSTDKWKKKINCAIHFADPLTKGKMNKVPSRRGWITKYIKSEWEPPSQTWQDAMPTWDSDILSPQYADPTRITPKPILDAIKQLARMKEIHILPADKGGNTVIWHRDDYDREAQRQLNDKKTYHELSRDEMDEHLITLKNGSVNRSDILLQMKNITKAEHTAIADSPNEPSKGYYLLKPHKSWNKISRSFPGRPIVATCSNVIHLLDKYLTEITAELLPLIPGSLRDTNDLIKRLPTDAPFASTKITTADVEGLYPSIPWEGGIDACVLFYREHLNYLKQRAKEKNKLEPPSTAIFADLLTLVVSNSYISFKNKRFFLQKLGTAMGMCISVFFANCFMYQTTRHLIENKPSNVHTFLRYIDDIIIISDETFDADEFFRGITTTHIKYTIEYPSDKQAFLDTYVTVSKGKIITSAYRKPTASGLFLNPNSNHPPHVFRGIPYAQFTRLRRICTHTADFESAAKQLKKNLTISGYDKRIIQESYNMALTGEKSNKDESKQKMLSESIKLIFPYDQAATETIISPDLTDLHDRIIQHYLTEGSDYAVSAIENQQSAIVNSINRPIGSKFTKHIKNPI